MNLLVDTSVWSLALRRDAALNMHEVVALRNALLGTNQVFSTGFVLQELLQGFSGPKARDSILDPFTALAVASHVIMSPFGAGHCSKQGT